MDSPASCVGEMSWLSMEGGSATGAGGDTFSTTSGEWHEWSNIGGERKEIQDIQSS